jgi:hypothetical protein
VTLARQWQLLKHALDTISIDEGIQIDRSSEQKAKADSSKTEMRQSTSKVQVERFQIGLKQAVAIVSIDEGMQRH